MFKESLTNEELNLSGKTGTGKSISLNSIFSRDIAEAKKTALVVAKKS